MIVSFKDPVTSLLHIVDSKDISQIDNKTVKVFVDSPKMFVIIEFEDELLLKNKITKLIEEHSMCTHDNNVSVTISFPEETKQSQPEIDIEMYGIDISSFLGDDGEFDENTLFNQFLMGDDFDDDEEDISNNDDD